MSASPGVRPPSRALSALLAVVLAGGLGACSSRAASRPGSGVTPSQTRQFLGRARPLLPGLPDYRLAQLALTVCDQFEVNSDGGDVAEVEIRRAAPVPVTSPDANDFMQASVLLDCPQLYDPVDFVHPHKYLH